MLRLVWARIPLAIFLAVTAVACGGGGGGGTPPGPGGVVNPPTGVPTPTPTPAPSPTATPTPTPITVSTQNLSFWAVGAQYAQSVTVAETGYSGVFTASGCNNIATISPASTADTFTFTPLAVGHCVAAFSNASGLYSPPVYVTVTTVQIVGQ